MRTLTALALVTFAGFGCSEALAPMYRGSDMRSLGDFVVRVDSMQLPARVVGGDSIEVRLFARVAGTSCFVWIVGSQFSSRRADITVWGRNGPPPPDCRLLNQQPLRFAVGSADSGGEEVFHVIVHQPGGSLSDREVAVMVRGPSP